MRSFGEKSAVFVGEKGLIKYAEIPVQGKLSAQLWVYLKGRPGPLDPLILRPGIPDVGVLFSSSDEGIAKAAPAAAGTLSSLTQMNVPITITAVAPGTTIVIENLTNIRKRVKAQRGEAKRRLHVWSFAQLKGFIEYKAGLLGDSWEGKVATGASYGFFRLTIHKRPSDD